MWINEPPPVANYVFAVSSSSRHDTTLKRQGCAMATNSASPSNGRTLEMNGNGNIGSVFIAIGREWTDFVNQRIKRDLALLERLTTCKEPGDVIRAYSDFWTETAEQYKSEATTLARLGSTINPVGLLVPDDKDGQRRPRQ
jgi:Phasin protein